MTGTANHRVIQGSCLCGQVRFQLNDDFSRFHFCHCVQCRKASGAAHGANFFTHPDNIQWHSGEQHIERYDVPGRTITNAFCRQCGSGLPYLSLSGTTLVVQAGCLDEAPSHAPDSNIFWSERASWYDAAIASAHHEGFPPEPEQ